MEQFTHLPGLADVAIRRSDISFLAVGAHPCDRPGFEPGGALDMANTRFTPTIIGILKIPKALLGEN